MSEPRITFGLCWPGWRWWLGRLLRGDRRAVLLGLYARASGAPRERGPR